MKASRNILLIITGGIAAYKALELIRLLRHDEHAKVRCILTKAGAEFVTPLSLQTLSEEEVYDDLFALTNSNRIEHIILSRQTDMIVVYPATANFMAKTATGLANDLASTLLLATPPAIPIIFAPAMNVQMWGNAATQHNYKLLKQRNIHFAGPEKGDMACGEFGYGRLISPQDMVKRIKAVLDPIHPLKGKKALVTAGPTYEPIDPVRFLGNFSSGKQGYAIAESLRDAGAEVTLISGPVSLESPEHIQTVYVRTAQEMLDACLSHLPTDIAIMTAAVSDWRVKQTSSHKIKKNQNDAPPVFELATNPDILATISRHETLRPGLVVGFAAETNDLLDNAEQKRNRKNCDWIIVNDVNPHTKIMGGEENEVTIVSSSGKQQFKRANKKVIAHLLTQEIIQFFNSKP